MLDSGVPVRLKAMALRSTAHELDEISAFCRARTKDYYRFGALQKGCREGKLIMPEHEHGSCDHLFHCGAGNGSFSLG